MIKKIIIPSEPTNRGDEERVVVLFDNGRRFCLYANGRLEEWQLAPTLATEEGRWNLLLIGRNKT